MTLQDFIDKYSGKFVEVAGSSNAKFQCVDCANAWIREGLNLPIIEWTNAYDFPSKAGNNYDIILNTPTGVPLPGDLVIFKSADGVGHISIFVSGNSSSFTSFDQNYPLGSPCKLVNHNYRNVVSWMHPKDKNYKGIDLTNSESLKVCIDVWKDVVDGKYKTLQDYNAVETTLNVLNDFKQRIADKVGATNQIEDIESQISTLIGVESKFEDLSRKYESLQADKTAEAKNYETKVNDLSTRITELQTEYQQQLEKIKQNFDREINLLKQDNERLVVQVSDLQKSQQQVIKAKNILITLWERLWK